MKHETDPGNDSAGGTLVKIKKWSNLKDRASSRIKDAQGLVLAHRTDGAAVLIPADAVDQIRVGVTELVHELPCTHVPHANHVVTA